ncbi:MAG TPA: ATP-binding cassette domain-containing protein [Acidimicrobiales bacterium]|nr:ATP-binding cassette domain-containing protein [Acidimicrobiales bacterium]
MPAGAAARPVPLEVEDLTKVSPIKPLSRLRRTGAGAPGERARVALDGVSLWVHEGEIYGVLGANGSGKSTLVPIVSTLLVPNRGSVRIFGHDAVREPATVRPLINRVSVDPSFFKPMSALENLLFFGRVYGLSGPEVRRSSVAILDRPSTLSWRPVPRVVHLLGMSALGVVHALVRTGLIMACSLPSFHVDLARADWVTAACVVGVGSVSLVGLGILSGILPLLYPERGE